MIFCTQPATSIVSMTASAFDFSICPAACARRSKSGPRPRPSRVDADNQRAVTSLLLSPCARSITNAARMKLSKLLDMKASCAFDGYSCRKYIRAAELRDLSAVARLICFFVELVKFGELALLAIHIENRPCNVFPIARI